MSREAIRCPQCGGSLDVGRGAGSTKCAYCGSTIQLKVDAAGQALPVLEEMRQDASIVAKRAAIEFMEASLAKWVKYRADLEHDMEKKCKTSGNNQMFWALLSAGLGFCIGLVVDMSNALTYAIVLGLAGLILSLIVLSPPAVKKVKASYAPRIAEADATIRKHDERIRDLRASVARLALTV